MFAERLKELRKICNISQSQLANAMFYSHVICSGTKIGGKHEQNVICFTVT